ncbi:pseudouridine synthase [Sneathiella sp. HT1-7]|jgi:23S rRNA pseudouridine2457 synthase|uniref:pseudouridine synthase n=1 Tax=Sneathiella sp. HT1-7 TaxID=2887192 RepID=UPI001D13847F|nr:pseudouridine synthase [Sneathiella sp. HT1-7]MCC3304508.1 pseudouridine synthase [Sneathiella sp. HT1-7]
MPRYIAFYKPYGVLSQFTGEKGQRTLADFALPEKVYAAGRLDKDSEGLLLLSDDGPFIKKLLNPDNAHERVYWVEIEGEPNKAALEELSGGVVFKGYKSKPCRVSRLDPQPDIAPRDPPVRFRKSIPTCWIEIALTEGKNRQVRRMTASVGHPTLRLIRKKIGKLTLTDLVPGIWQDVKKMDIF